ncbi:hypothetical protein HPB50_013549 [Hyalomma asiaticum]|uniref:Uncharacterized protein n=1 Tax=Hyalomma asiaticum TaxID=266040 RepID=A0ACB7SQS3_HYAAI|nr:hypothetical protein HPB50_013549 [Hyalomma asiaticum]
MVIDIVQFFFIYTLVLFSFACGLNQLLWYYADLEQTNCDPHNIRDSSCLTWRRFSNLFESSQSLFWASFGLVDLSNFELTGIKSYTRFWGLLMFGSYSVINIVVLLNLLIAMMSNSYQRISVSDGRPPSLWPITTEEVRRTSSVSGRFEAHRSWKAGELRRTWANGQSTGHSRLKAPAAANSKVEGTAPGRSVERHR